MINSLKVCMSMHKLRQSKPDLSGSVSKDCHANRQLQLPLVSLLQIIFLQIHFTYGGKTAAINPKSEFPKCFSLTANQRHYSNTDEFLKLLDEIIIPYMLILTLREKCPNTELFLVCIFLYSVRSQENINVKI